MISPQLKNAESADVYYARKGRSGGWMTTIKTTDTVTTHAHPHERAAREYVGLEGGSPDPEYRPLNGENGYERAIGGEAPAVAA
jgi:hypothetical protein